jgi:AbrB family looped-hinge helix DNA binding protein
VKATIDAAGRLVIPKQIRREAGLQPGAVLDVRWQEGRIEIEPAPLAVDLVSTRGLLAAMPRTEVGDLRAELVGQTQSALRWERSAGT